MNEPLTGKIESLRLEGPFLIKKGKNEGKSFHTHKLTINGLELSQTDFRKEPKSPANIGDNVKVLYTTSGNGKFINNYISELEVLDDSELQVNLTTTKSHTEVNSAKAVPQNKPSFKSIVEGNGVLIEVSKPQQTGLVSKDTSMEVSGLLQALINTGNFTSDAVQGQLHLEELELSLKHVLRLKRQVALELEQNGTV